MNRRKAANDVFTNLFPCSSGRGAIFWRMGPLPVVTTGGVRSFDPSRLGLIS
jgi:hypothetical protein